MRYLFLSLSSLDAGVRRGEVRPEHVGNALFCFAASKEHSYTLDANTDEWLWQADYDKERRRIVWRHENEPGNTYFHAMRCNYLLQMHGYRQVDLADIDHTTNLYGLARLIEEANRDWRWEHRLVVLTTRDRWTEILNEE